MTTREEQATQNAQFRAMVKAVHDDNEAEINGRKYQFSKMVHKERRKVFAFYTKVARQVNGQDFSFLDSVEFEPVEEVINSRVLFEGSTISKLPDHWDRYPEDYLPFISIAMAVISFPFMPADSIS